MSDYHNKTDQGYSAVKYGYSTVIFFFFHFKCIYVIYTFFSKTFVFIGFEILFNSSEYGAQWLEKFYRLTKTWLVQIFATEIELDTAFHVYSALFMKISCNNKDIFISLYRDMQDILPISKTYEAAVKNRPLWKAILFTAASWACIAASL